MTAPTTAKIQTLLRGWLRLSAAARFEQATRAPMEAQRQKLLDIVGRNRNTVYGREYGFAGVRCVADFQASAPVTTYERLEPYVARMLEGARGVLTAERPLMYAITSGTTGRAKFIPVTPSYLAEYTHAVNVHTYRMFADYQDILLGRVLVSSSSDVEGRVPEGTAYGAISGHLARRQPAPIRRFFALPADLCAVHDVDAKYYLMLRYGLMDDVRVLVAPNPSTLVLLAERMGELADVLIHDIGHGTVERRFVSDDVPWSLIERLRPDRDRADALRRVVRRTGGLRPADAWPNLRLLSCWKGGTMPLYLRRLPEFYGNCPIRDIGYMASEGRGATPLVNAGAAGVLSVTSHFFEFVRAADRDGAAPEFLTCDQLEADEEYYIYLTTSAGLYRYDINDIVRVADFHHDTPVIQFVRKGGGVTSITGEKLTEAQVTEALVETVAAGGYDLRHFTARIQWGSPPCYALYAELGDDMPRERRLAFARDMDRALARANLEYESKRSSRRLGAPVLRSVAPGSYDALRQRRVSEGAPEAQVKIAQLSTSLDFGSEFTVLDEIAVD